MNLAQFLFGLALPCAYWPNVFGWALETNWPWLWACLPAFLLFTRPIRMTPAHWVGLALMAWALLSGLWAPYYYFVEECLKLGACVCAFLLGSEWEDDRWLWRGLTAGIAVNSVVAIFQHFGMSPVFFNSPSGFFLNPNAAAEPAIILLLVLCAQGSYFSSLVSGPLLFFTYSRAAAAAAIVGCFAFLWQQSRLACFALVVVAALPLAAFYHSGAKPYSTTQRLHIWTDTIHHLSPLGHGFGSFGFLFPDIAEHVNIVVEGRAYHSHSDFLEVAFELGIPGAALFTLLAILLILHSAPLWRPPLLASIALVAIDFPLHMPTSAFLIAYVAGRAASGWHERCLVRSHRRPALYQGRINWRLLWDGG